MMNESVGERLRRLRRESKISKPELGKRINMHPQTIWHWEAGRTAPTLYTCMDLVKIYHCSLDYLAGLTEDRNPR